MLISYFSSFNSPSDSSASSSMNFFDFILRERLPRTFDLFSSKLEIENLKLTLFKLGAVFGSGLAQLYLFGNSRRVELFKFDFAKFWLDFDFGVGFLLDFWCRCFCAGHDFDFEFINLI